MKLYTMECVYDPAIGVSPFKPGKLWQKEYFVKLETSDEEDIYDDAMSSENDNDYADYNRWLEDKIGLTDYYVRLYFMASESGLLIGDTYTDADGLIWKRVE